MKTMTSLQYMKPLVSMFLILFLTACSKDDGPSMDTIPVKEQLTIFGIWKTQNEIFHRENARYIIINDDYSITILIEDGLGFRRIDGGYKVTSNNEIAPSSRFVGVGTYEYLLEDNDLTVFDIENGTEVTLTRDSNGPSTNSWVKTLTIIEQANAPWNRNVDIAYNGAMILFPNGRENQNIGLVNPSTLSFEGEWETDIHTYSVEIEKRGNGEEPLTFQTDTEEAIFNAYTTNGYVLEHRSVTLGVFDSFGLLTTGGGTPLRGLASTGNQQIWASNNFSKELFLYDYSGPGVILEQIPLEIAPCGLDFQESYLYVSDGSLLHKCQTSPSFKVVESYKIPGHGIYGIAYDGANFWLNVQKYPDNSDEILFDGRESDNKLMKVALSI